MGWASAGLYFEIVADALIDAGASDALVERVCTDLIKALQDDDWDTEDESLERYTDVPAVKKAFRVNGVVSDCWKKLQIGSDARTDIETHYCDSEAGHIGSHHDSWSGQYWFDQAEGE